MNNMKVTLMINGKFDNKFNEADISVFVHDIQYKMYST